MAEGKKQKESAGRVDKKFVTDDTRTGYAGTPREGTEAASRGRWRWESPYRGSGGAKNARLTADDRQLILDMEFEFFQANFLELLIFRKPGFLEQFFELLRIVTMLFFQAAYCFTIRLTVRFQIHSDSSGAGSFPAEPRLFVVRRASWLT